MSLPNYDNWLCYNPADDADGLFERFCEEHNVEYDDPDAERMYQDWIESFYDYEPEEPDYEDFDERDYND